MSDNIKIYLDDKLVEMGIFSTRFDKLMLEGATRQTYKLNNKEVILDRIEQYIGLDRYMNNCDAKIFLRSK